MDSSSILSIHIQPIISLAGYSHGLLSPNGQYLAVASAGRVVLRLIAQSDALQKVYQCVDKIDKVEFSADSQYIMCVMLSRQAIQVFSVEDSEWKCRINENSTVGIVSATWAPNSRMILTESDFGIQMSLWSLVDGTQSVMSLPKPPQKQYRSVYHAFSPCSQYLSIVHRVDLQDTIAVYSMLPAAELSRFKAKSNDINTIAYAPSGHIVTADSPLVYKLHVYTPAGDCVCTFEPYQHALGIKLLRCQGAVLAIGSFDQKVRLLSSGSFQFLATFPLAHIPQLDFSLLPPGMVTTVEVGSEDLGSMADLDTTSSTLPPRPPLPPGSSIVVQKMLKALPKASSDTKTHSGLPPQGVATMEISPLGGYLAALNEAHPRCVWIYSLGSLRLTALLVLQAPVSALCWRHKARGAGQGSQGCPWLIDLSVHVGVLEQPSMLWEHSGSCMCSSPPRASSPRM
ncbi:WD40 repeat domain-containing protein, partial [archaeon]